MLLPEALALEQGADGRYHPVIASPSWVGRMARLWFSHPVIGAPGEPIQGTVSAVTVEPLSSEATADKRRPNER
jgi:hypothetical protein